MHDEQKFIRECVDIRVHHIVNLVKYYSSFSYSSDANSDAELCRVMQVVHWMWALDNEILEIPNMDGSLCEKYPPNILVPLRTIESPTRLPGVEIEDYEKSYDKTQHDKAPKIPKDSDQESEDNLNDIVMVDEDDCMDCFMKRIAKIHEEVPKGKEILAKFFRQGDNHDAKKNSLRNLFKAAKFARCRQRFPVPVMIYRDVYIVRSATVSDGKEVASQQLKSAVVQLAAALTGMNLPQSDTVDAKEICMMSDRILLSTLGIKDVFDLMVENKKFKFAAFVSSSEKIEPSYDSLKLHIIPYPGCEFFGNLAPNNYESEKVFYKFSSPEDDAVLQINNPVLLSIQKNWNYKTWPLHHLTRVYLMLMLKQCKDVGKGLLVHCISGWDRTPLFVSLLRLSLWADGEIHQSLNPAQILYFTLAYDWMFFGHNLENRMAKKEEVMIFCFIFLKYIKYENFNTNSEHFGKLSECGSRPQGAGTNITTGKPLKNLEECLAELAMGGASPLSSPETSPESSQFSSPEKERLVDDEEHEGFSLVDNFVSMDVPGAKVLKTADQLGRSTPGSYGYDAGKEKTVNENPPLRQRRLEQVRTLFFVVGTNSKLFDPEKYVSTTATEVTFDIMNRVKEYVSSLLEGETPSE